MTDRIKTEEWFEKRGFDCKFIDLNNEEASYLLVRNRANNACAQINFAQEKAVVTVFTDIDNEIIWEILNKG